MTCSEFFTPDFGFVVSQSSRVYIQLMYTLKQPVLFSFDPILVGGQDLIPEATQLICAELAPAHRWLLSGRM